jgi:hypothetical protein
MKRQEMEKHCFWCLREDLYTGEIICIRPDCQCHNKNKHYENKNQTIH